MAQISIEALYTGEGAGGKYGSGGKARAAGGGTNENRGRFHIGLDRSGTVLFP